MSVKTFPAEPVRRLVRENFVFVELDIEEHEDAAEWLGVSAIPDIIILSLDGNVVDRKQGFVPPAEFARWLRRYVE